MIRFTSKQKLLFKILLIYAILGIAYYLNQHGIHKASFDWIYHPGPWRPFVFIGLFVLASIFLIPSVIPTFASGVLFGLSRGVLFSLIGLGLGAVSAFLVGRYLAKEWILKRFSKYEKFELMGEMIRQKGWKIVALARLSPIFPFLIGNYLFGLTHVSARHYFIASVIGSIPATIISVYLGTLSRNLAFFGHQNSFETQTEWLIFLGGLIATVILTFYLKHIAQKVLSGDVGRNEAR